MTATCATCRYFVADEAEISFGECRRFPPHFEPPIHAIHIGENEDDGEEVLTRRRAEWPSVYELDWCGEWKALPPKVPEVPGVKMAPFSALRRVLDEEIDRFVPGVLMTKTAEVGKSEISKYWCCAVFAGFANRNGGPDRGHGSIGWITDQGEPRWGTSSFYLKFCPFCGALLRGPNGEAL